MFFDNTTTVEPEPNPAVLGVGFAPGAFTREECQQIVAMSERSEHKPGTLGDRKIDNSGKRKSEICNLIPDEETKWIFSKIAGMVVSANENYKFDLTGIEPLQIATYKLDHYYGWHRDIGRGHNSTRKLAVSLQLSDSDDYEGGDLEFSGGGVPPVAPRDMGTLIIFPSYLTHQVAPVTKGVRQSMVAWVHGPAFK